MDPPVLLISLYLPSFITVLLLPGLDSLMYSSDDCMWFFLFVMGNPTFYILHKDNIFPASSLRPQPFVLQTDVGCFSAPPCAACGCCYPKLRHKSALNGEKMWQQMRSQAPPHQTTTADTQSSFTLVQILVISQRQKETSLFVIQYTIKWCHKPIRKQKVVWDLNWFAVMTQKTFFLFYTKHKSISRQAERIICLFLLTLPCIFFLTVGRLPCLDMFFKTGRRKETGSIESPFMGL